MMLKEGEESVSCLGQREKYIDRNFPKGGGRCVQPIFSTKVATNMETEQGKSN